MNESIDTLDRAFELLKAPVAGTDFDLSKKRVEELMMSELSKSRSRPRRKTLLAAIAVLTVLVAGGALAATTGAWRAIEVFVDLDLPEGKEIKDISAEFQFSE